MCKNHRLIWEGRGNERWLKPPPDMGSALKRTARRGGVNPFQRVWRASLRFQPQALMRLCDALAAGLAWAQEARRALTGAVLGGAVR